jgi:ATP-binding cassette subfamily B protein
MFHPPIPSGTPPPKLKARLLGSFSHTPRTIGLVWQSAPRGLVGLVFLVLAAAVLPLSVAWVGKLIVDAVVAAQAAAAGPARDAAVGVAVRWVLVELGLFVAISLTERTIGLARQLVGSRLSIDINVRILEKALTLDLAHFENSEFYDKLVRARREASSRPLSLVQQNFVLLRNTLTLAGYAAFLVRFSPWAALGLLLAAVPAFVSEVKFSGAEFRLRNWRSPENRRLNYLEHVIANDEHAKEVKLFGLGPMLLGRYRGLAETFFGQDKQLAIRRAGWTFGLSLLATAAFYGCYVAVAVAAARGTITLGAMTLYLVAFRQGQQSFQSVLSAVGGMYEDNLYMSNLFEFLAIPTGANTPGERQLSDDIPSGIAPGERQPTVDVAGRAARVRVEEGIRFENVGFCYPGAEGWALRGVSVFIPKGESLALVGENGAGKTTFIKLLTRLYAPTEGRILLDGRDLQAWDAAELRGRIGVIFQDFNQYQFVLRENVGTGSVEHIEDRPRVQRAVERGGAQELVASLTQGLETQLGRWFKGGAELSGGQWQKVALARAFMREEADILVLDEPTAALDATAEHAVFERFRRLAHGRTAILISHRFPTVRMADRILVIEHGRIVEQGTHEHLLQEGGRYAKLFTLQAEGYR